jgi:ssRNA-specific RNase YbeY (16S rRNA maturation enzyme)
MINVYSSSRYKIAKKNIANHAQKFLTRYNLESNYIFNIVFVGVRKMKQVANTYKNEDVALPVLSFSYPVNPAIQDEQVIGEVIICYPQAVLLAAEREKRVDILLQNLIEHGIENILGRQS